MRSNSRLQGTFAALSLGCAFLLTIAAGTPPSPQTSTLPQNSAGQENAAPSQTAPPPAHNPAAPEHPGTPAMTTPSRTTAHSIPFFVMIDPGHGGNDYGALLADDVPEKDLTLALARRVKNELQERGIPAHLLRDADYSLGVEQRAEISNEQHAAVYLSIHASPPGEGVRVYAPALASPPAPATGRFLPWESAQSAYLGRSRALAKAVAAELNRKAISAAMLSSPFRPLNNVNAPAIAVELVEDDETHEITSARFQNAVAAAVAATIAQMRPQLEGQP